VQGGRASLKVEEDDRSVQSKIPSQYTDSSDRLEQEMYKGSECGQKGNVRLGKEEEREERQRQKADKDVGRGAAGAE
jgi:hypothetical protein